jgi:hypothetical protein
MVDVHQNRRMLCFRKKRFFRYDPNPWNFITVTAEAASDLDSKRSQGLLHFHWGCPALMAKRRKNRPQCDQERRPADCEERFFGFLLP